MPPNKRRVFEWEKRKALHVIGEAGERVGTCMPLTHAPDIFIGTEFDYNVLQHKLHELAATHPLRAIYH